VAGLYARGRHGRCDRGPGRAGQPRVALQPAVRTQRGGHRRTDPTRGDHQTQSLHLRVHDRGGDQITPSAFTEDADIRAISPTRNVDDSYANAYGNRKWAGEVLLREANELADLPVAVFRCDMILADTRYTGSAQRARHVHPNDAEPGGHRIAPGSFYELDANGDRQRAH
jgi:Male sterility protein